MKQALFVVLVFSLVFSTSFCFEEDEQNSKRCKKEEYKFHPLQTRGSQVQKCSNYRDCFSCTNDTECGWCGGAGCGTTAIGCYNKTSVVESGMCIHPDDRWIKQYHMCEDWCIYQTECNLCLNHPSGVCGFCKDSGSCRRGNLSNPEINKQSCYDWRFKHRLALYTPDYCETFIETCASSKTCNSCLRSWIGPGLNCIWCADENISLTSYGGVGVCIEPNQNCSSNQVRFNFFNSTNCPQLPSRFVASSSNHLVIDRFFFIFLFILILFQ